MVVNYAVHLFLGVQGTFILIGIGVSSVTHLVFGGLGGILAALIVGRLYRAGVVHQGDVPDEVGARSDTRASRQRFASKE